MLEIVQFILCVLRMVRQSLTARALLFLTLVRLEAGELWYLEMISQERYWRGASSGSTRQICHSYCTERGFLRRYDSLWVVVRFQAIASGVSVISCPCLQRDRKKGAFISTFSHFPFMT